VFGGQSNTRAPLGEPGRGAAGPCGDIARFRVAFGTL